LTAVPTNPNERIREVLHAAHELVAFFEEVKRDIRAAIAKVQKGK
jgi:hypothetical protein